MTAVSKKVVNINALAKSVAADELPATAPVVLESSARRLQWERQLADAIADRDLIEMQIESAARVCEFAVAQAYEIADAEAKRADERAEGKAKDAASVRDAAIDGFRRIEADLDLVISGAKAALASSSPASTEIEG